MPTQAKRNTLRTIIAGAIMAAALSCAPSFAASGTADLTADLMNYDPSTGAVRVSGNVLIERDDGEIRADEGAGLLDGSRFELAGNIAGSFTTDEGEVALTCDFVTMSAVSGDRTVIATGGVVMMRGNDRIESETLQWSPGGKHYKAAGGVVGRFMSYSIDADEMTRSGDEFSALGVRRYEDGARGMTLCADSVDGIIKDEQVVEMTAKGAVELESYGDEHGSTTVSGNSAVFSVARGTIVVSGNAIVMQAGRVLNAGSVVYHLDTGRVEANDRPTLFIDLD